MGHEDGFDDVASVYLNADKMLHLFTEGFQKPAIIFKISGIAGADSHFSARAGIDTIVQGDLQNLGQVEISCQDVTLGAESPAFHTSAGTAIAGVVNIFPLPRQLLDDGVGIEDGRLSESGFGDLNGSVNEPVRIFLAHLHHGTGL